MGEKVNNSYKVGDWVGNLGEVKGSVGYISETSGDMHLVQIMKHRNPKMVGKEKWYYDADMMSAPTELTTQSVEFMIELSLQTHDKEWFDHLMAMMKSNRMVNH